MSIKPHYFNDEEPDSKDIHLGMAKMQGYVPQTCLLGGMVVMTEINAGRNPCDGCSGPREKCKGKPQSTI